MQMASERRSYALSPAEGPTIILLPAALRARIEAEVDRLLDLLDAIDGDADREPSLCLAEGIGLRALEPGAEGGDDREGGDGDDEEGGDDEPDLGSLDATAHGRQGQDEWSAGSGDDGEAGDDNGVGDADGRIEQGMRFVQRGGCVRLVAGWL